METPVHSLNSLFAQLGLADDADAIDRFIAEHSPLDPQIKIADAPFWTSSQAAFLRQQLLADADWAERVDELSLRLRA